MWYIEEICVSRYNSPIEKVNSISYDMELKLEGHVSLWLRSTENKSGIAVSSFTATWDEFESKLLKLNPYGLILGRSGMEDAVFAITDYKAIKFLDYVDSVFEVTSPSAELLRHASRLHLECSPVDEYKSIFSVGGTETLYSFCLLYILCFSSAGWFGDCYYLRSGKRVWCVKFTDVRKARAFIGKVSTDGYNPINVFARELKYIAVMMG